MPQDTLDSSGTVFLPSDRLGRLTTDGPFQGRRESSESSLPPHWCETSTVMTPWFPCTKEVPGSLPGSTPNSGRHCGGSGGDDTTQTGDWWVSDPTRDRPSSPVVPRVETGRARC